MTLGKCPYCNDGAIEVRDKEVNGKKVKLYACRKIRLSDFFMEYRKSKAFPIF